MPIPDLTLARITNRRPFTPSMLAERWQCSERHIRNLIASGDLRAFKVGGRLIRISVDTIEAFEAGGIEDNSDRSEHQRRREAANAAARLVRMTVCKK